MNIIISSTGTDGVRFVNYDSSSSYDINKIKLFISKSLNITPSVLELYYNDPSIVDDIEQSPNYSLQVTQNPALEKNNYFGYELHTDFSVAPQKYEAILKLNGYELKFVTPLQVFNELEDEHEPVVINDRTIGKINTVIVAEDYCSQQIKFVIKERYDGVSILDANKKIYVDYIPPDFIPMVDPLDPNNMINFLSHEITEKNIVILDGDNWVELRWNLPPSATKTQGNVKFAITVINNQEPIYIWQTLPSTFTVSANLAKRPTIPVASAEESTILVETIERINTLEDFTDNLNNVSELNAEEGTFTYTQRKDGSATTSEHSIFDLAYAGDEEVIINPNEKE